MIDPLMEYLKVDRSVALTEDYPAPWLRLRVLYLLKRNYYSFGSKGLTKVSLPYNSGVWDSKQCLYIISRILFQKHTISDSCVLIFHHSPLFFCCLRQMSVVSMNIMTKMK